MSLAPHRRQYYLAVSAGALVSVAVGHDETLRLDRMDGSLWRMGRWADFAMMEERGMKKKSKLVTASREGEQAVIGRYHCLFSTILGTV